MFEDFDALAAKLTEIAGCLRNLRDENQQLRTELAHADAEKQALRRRADEASARIDALLARLPQQPAPPSQPTSLL